MKKSVWRHKEVHYSKETYWYSISVNARTFESEMVRKNDGEFEGNDDPMKNLNERRT